MFENLQIFEGEIKKKKEEGVQQQDPNHTMKASDDGGYHVCDNEPFYDDYESSQEMSAANQ